MGLACQAVCRLVDADNEMVGILRCQMPCRQTNSATCIENQRGGTGSVPGGNAVVKCATIVVGNGFAERRGGVFCQQARQLCVDTSLAAGDGGGVQGGRKNVNGEGGKYKSRQSLCSCEGIAGQVLINAESLIGASSNRIG